MTGVQTCALPISKLQNVVALSTTEAEYMAAVQAGKEIKWMRNLMHELGIPLPGASTLLLDNQSAISVAKNPEHHGRMKQLDLCYYWLRDAVQEQAITPSFVPTTQQAADLLTKPLTTPKVREFCQMLGLGVSGGSQRFAEMHNQGGMLILGVCAPLIALCDAFLVITSAVSFQG